MTRIANFCNNIAGLIVFLFALSHAVIPKHRCGWINAKYNVLRRSIGSTCLTCLIENNALDTFLLTPEMCFFQV